MITSKKAPFSLLQIAN